ncbi:hypothetical protein ACG33_00055 [Steroidobacter denitrificans]|uniref:DUF4868 domain-containing protein n=1 Tax=Steroidobacter denitrificans TaxID=465721 RepID=A0A127F7E7_STEDE|nr:anti-phage protein KwaB [Steroidobacter denitrificans]AMN45518.1 hypothetical protein ACG33_00055 [Steroidobacter denitrificans]
MNAAELKETLQTYYDDYENIGVSVYAVLKNPENPGPLKLDIEAEASVGLKELFIQSLRDRFSNKDELTVIDLSSADERVDAVYVYDLEIPDELTSLETVISQDDLPLLNLSDESLSSIKALLIEIGNNVGQLVFYKTMAPVNIFGRASFFLRKTQSRLERLEDEFLRVSAGFQMLRINGSLLVLDLESVEKSFGFHDVIKREAAAGISAIEAARLIVNSDVLRELLDDVKYARRLTKVAKASPVLKAGVPSQDIVRFCQTFPNLAGRIRFNETEDRIVLDTKVSKDLFIKLLMDDFLTSELTKFHYTSVAKDSVDKEPEEP